MKTQEEVVREHAVGPINIYKIYQDGYNDRDADDWSAFRREAAKDILCGMVTLGFREESVGMAKATAKAAILYADELIRQLKVQEK